MRSTMVARWLLVLLGVLGWRADAQVRIISPFTVSARFSGEIHGTTSLFGAPSREDRILGTLVVDKMGTWTGAIAQLQTNNYNSYQPYGHTQQLPTLLTAREALASKFSQPKVNSQPIVIARRIPGYHSLARYVKYVQDCGAAAVIFVDQDQPSGTAAAATSPAQRFNPGYDNFGSLPGIPSIYISQQDGEALFAAAQHDTEPVSVELVWGQDPRNGVVQMEQWTSSASTTTFLFLKEFAAIRKALNGLVNYVPRYQTISQHAPDLNELCLDDEAKLCAPDPDGIGPITGRQVAAENARQLCIYELYKVKSPGAGTKPAVVYNREFWDYVTSMLDDCPLDGKDVGSRFGKVCSEGVMAKVGIDVKGVRSCFERTWHTKLVDELNQTAWSSRAVRIDQWKLEGPVTVDNVVRSICSEFSPQPDVCKNLTATGASKVIVQSADGSSTVVTKAVADKLKSLKGRASELSEELRALAHRVEVAEDEEEASRLSEDQVPARPDDLPRPSRAEEAEKHAHPSATKMQAVPNRAAKQDPDEVVQIARSIKYWVSHWERIALCLLLACLMACGVCSFVRGASRRVRQWRQRRVGLEASDQCLLEMGA